MMYMHETIQFKLTLGIYRRIRGVDGTGEHAFDTTICHTATFEIEWGSLPLNSSELPHRLLVEAQAQADLIAAKFKVKGDSEWSDTLPILPDGEWDNEPLWHGGGDVLECYQYWHDAFRSVHFLKLEWEDWRKG